ncbi:MAG: NADH-quinone oxidoreductase subunit M [Rickettsiaceae bacterium H1]|nr:NADH-quinone oxidoreductase subunit M [Rickettsiaceae bacterium H1]
MLFPFFCSFSFFVVKDNFRYLALICSVLMFVITLIITAYFHNHTGIHFIERFNLGNYSMKFGWDGISFIFILLTTFLTLLCMVVGWSKPNSYLALFLLLESIIIGLFSSFDLISFYIFFESSLIPMFFIIGIWGSDNRIYAAFKFFLYTFAGSVAFLVAIIFIYLSSNSTDILYLASNLDVISIAHKKLLWFALFIAFAVKIPMVPFHTWLPDAHVQAPTAGSVILAGILIKMGAYGFLRLSIPFFPEISRHYSDLIFILSSVAVIYGSLVALAQTDIKKIIAYSSIAHMGLVTAGIFSFTEQGLVGAIFQMFSHGIISAGLFLCVGVIYDRKHTRNISDYGGLANVMPVYAFAFIALSMASIGLPGTSGFIGEFLPIVGVLKTSKVSAFFLAFGIILGAVYMLWLCKRIIWGEAIANVKDMTDLTRTERFVLFSLLVLVLVFGLQPQLVIRFIEEPVRNIIGLI